MKRYFDEMSMVLLMQQNESLQKEFASLGYDSSKESLEQMKVLINNNFLNHKCKKALNKIFDILYREDGEYDADKEWDSGTLNDVADEVLPLFEAR